MLHNTINSVVNSNLCVGCGTCIALCPKGAIILTKNNHKGIYLPLIDENKCNKCGICYKICPGHEVNFKDLNLNIFGKNANNSLIGNYLKCYTGYSKDYNIRYNSTSGGLITQILISALKEGIIDGALVTRMKKDNPLEPEPFIARTEQEVIDASKSKYCPVPANIALHEILNSNNDEKFAVVGLSCHIHGIRKAELINNKLKEKIVLRLGIVCNQTPTFLATEYIFKTLNINASDVKKLNYRGEGWPGKMEIFQNNFKKQIDLGDYWGSGFGQFFYPIRCTTCCDHTAELADISFADAWIPLIKQVDNIGTSILISRSHTGSEFLKKEIFKDKIYLQELKVSEVIKSQQNSINFKKNYIKSRMVLLKLFGEKIPHYEIDGLHPPTLYSYFKGLFLYTKICIFSRKLFWKVLMFYNIFKKRIVNYIRELIG